jgi:tRNA threonylcarbamoyladenosine biosynthesis protein TsaB
MNLLALETSSATAGLALCAERSLVASRTFPSRTSLCRDLIREIGALLEGVGGKGWLEAIAVSLGPGSFTSLRVGVMTAKALAHRLSLPLAGVPTLEALATPFAATTGSTVCVLQPAWKSNVYLARYAGSPSGELREIAAPAARGIGAAIEELRGTAGELLLVGEAALEHRAELLAALGERAALACESLCAPDARLVAEAAWRRLESLDPQAAHRVRPLYLVPSQAERAAGVDLGLA